MPVFFVTSSNSNRVAFSVCSGQGVAGGRADATVLFGDQRVVVERFVRDETPEFLAHALVHVLGECLGETIGQRLEDDRGIVVVVGLETGQVFFDTEAGSDGKAADPVGLAEFLGRDEIGEAEVGALGWFVGLLAQAVQGGQHGAAP